MVPAIPMRLSLVKLLIELELYATALLVVHGIMSSNDQDVEAWYLEGWCFYLICQGEDAPYSVSTYNHQACLSYLRRYSEGERYTVYCR